MREVLRRPSRQVEPRFRDESGCSDADCNNNFFQQFMAGKRELTLGSMNIILRSSKERAFRQFVSARLFPDADDTVFSQDAMLALLDEQSIRRFRNGAAHDEVMERDDAEAARAWALSILRYL